MDFYLIYIPSGKDLQWEAMSENIVPDIGAFPSCWYKKYSIANEKQEVALAKLRVIKDDFNKRKVTPFKKINIFPELEDITKNNINL